MKTGCTTITITLETQVQYRIDWFIGMVTMILDAARLKGSITKVSKNNTKLA